MLTGVRAAAVHDGREKGGGENTCRTRERGSAGSAGSAWSAGSAGSAGSAV